MFIFGINLIRISTHRNQVSHLFRRTKIQFSWRHQNMQFMLIIILFDINFSFMTTPILNGSKLLTVLPQYFSQTYCLPFKILKFGLMAQKRREHLRFVRNPIGKENYKYKSDSEKTVNKN